MSEYDYYTASPYYIFAKAEGYFDGLDEQAAMFRSLAFVTHRSMGGQDDIISKWPLFNDPKPEPLKMWTEDELKEMTTRANEAFRKRKVAKG